MFARCCLSHSDAELGVLEKRFSALLRDRFLLGDSLTRRTNELRLSQIWFAARLAAHAQRLIWQDAAAAAADMSDLSGTEIGAIMQQIRDTGASLH